MASGMTMNEWLIRKRCNYITQTGLKSYTSMFDEGSTINVQKFFGTPLQKSDIVFKIEGLESATSMAV